MMAPYKQGYHNISIATADLLMEYQSKSAGGILKVAGVQQILAVAEIF